MELMSSLLFCALVAYLPQVLGEKRDPRARYLDTDIKFNTSMMINQMLMPKKVLLNINGPPLVNMMTDLQVVFMDMKCKKCIDCMERAIKAHRSHNYIIKNRPNTDELNEEVLEFAVLSDKRSKRHTETVTTAKPKRAKSKKKTAKSVTVTKYNVDGEVYALKVKETNTQVNVDKQNDTQGSTCQVYSVMKSLPCGTPDADTFLTAAKRMTTKKNKKEKDRNKVATTTSSAKPHFIAPAFRKRHVDNSQVPENFMPSIEELY